jgi:hypothetical protein
VEVADNGLTQKPLFEAARTSGATPSELARWFQFPRSAITSAGLIRHVPNHADHVHVRFRCGTACASTAIVLNVAEDERKLINLLD